MTDHSTHRIKKHGKTKKGKQRWFCHDCNKTFTPDASPRGNKPQGDRALTAAEKMRRYREKKRKEDS
jgi:transposase-like protein